MNKKLRKSIAISLIAILYSAYFVGYSNYSNYQKETIQKEKKGLVGEVLEKITVLEKKLIDQDKTIFDIVDNPTKISRVIEIEGFEESYQASSDDIKLSVIMGREPDITANIFYDNKQHNLLF